MLYLVPDTCVWIDLLKAQLNTPLNGFDEFMYWIDKNELTCITCENLIREWDRNKIDKNIINSVVTVHIGIARNSHYPEMRAIADRDFIEAELQKRIDRIDYVLREKSILAPQTNDILLEAGNRNLYKQAPNHAKDSYRDTVNILCILEHLKANPTTPVYFTSINYKDFSSKDNKHLVHPDLATLFSEVGLNYEHYTDYTESILLKRVLRPALPNHADFLREEKIKKVKAEANPSDAPLSNPPEIDPEEYINNLEFIDTILKRKKPGAADKKILEFILELHPSYKQYFFSKIGNDGVV